MRGTPDRFIKKLRAPIRCIIKKEVLPAGSLSGVLAKFQFGGFDDWPMLGTTKRGWREPIQNLYILFPIRALIYPSSPISIRMQSLDTPIKVTGSWDETRRTTVALPDIVLRYLRLESAAQDRAMQELILEAIVEYYELKPPAS